MSVVSVYYGYRIPPPERSFRDFAGVWLLGCVVYAYLASLRVSAASSSTPILAIAVPFKLEDGVPASPPSYLTSGSSSKPTIVLSTTFTSSSQPAIDALAWALAQDFTVNIDIQSDLQQDSGWDTFEDFLTKATASPDAKGKIVLCMYPCRSRSQSHWLISHDSEHPSATR